MKLKININAGIIILLFTITFIAFYQKINLTNSDIGRHIKNGEIVLNDKGVLNTNYYSYTEQNEDVVNHHWLSGVIYKQIYDIGGFSLLSILNSTLIALSIVLIYVFSTQNSSKQASLIALVISLPLIQSRQEIRPEFFSYLFISSYFILYNLSRYKIKYKAIVLIYIIIQTLWVNLHVYFIVGNLILFLLFAHSVLNKDAEKTKLFLLTSVIGTFANLLNPNFIRGALQPLTIFEKFGYLLAENQSIFFMHKRSPEFLYLYYFLLALILIELIMFNLNRAYIKQMLAIILLVGIFFIMGITSIRFIPLFGIGFALFAGYIFNKCFNNKYNNILAIIAIFLITLFTVFNIPNFSYINERTGRGLLPTGQNSATFFKSNNIQGPIFNNYDIGGYLIFHLYPEHRVFTDNRPEAYTVEFFQDIYIPMQQDDEEWDKQDSIYNFNVIYFYRHDLTPWGQNFMISRFNDPEWVPVYVDEYTIIFLRDNEVNKEIIENYKLPSELFSIVKT